MGQIKRNLLHCMVLLSSLYHGGGGDIVCSPSWASGQCRAPVVL